MKKWKGKHQHKCPDCGTVFDCPINNETCGCEYAEYPCINDIMKHCIELTTELPSGL